MARRAEARPERRFLKSLPYVCKFYKMQPSEYWRLTVPEYNALAEYMTEYAEQVEEANRG